MYPRCGYVRVVRSGRVLASSGGCVGGAAICSPEPTGRPPALKRPRQPSGRRWRCTATACRVGLWAGCCTTAQSVLRWTVGYVDEQCAKPTPAPVSVIEIDEMWRYLGCKAHKLWIWKAHDRDRLIDWECGERDETTFRRLLDRRRGATGNARPSGGGADWAYRACLNRVVAP